MKTKSDLYRKFFIAWGNALQDPANERVIIETEEDEKLNPETCPKRYYMIDGADFVGDDFHTEERTDRLWQVASSDGSYCHGASSRNVARWASLMIEHGRATNIYNDVY